jgi:hypothetical protein
MNCEGKRLIAQVTPAAPDATSAPMHLDWVLLPATFAPLAADGVLPPAHSIDICSRGPPPRALSAVWLL